ncbi:MAG: hypothetical protein ACRESK_10480 [Gammaproteobacteria bacterium]
MKYILGMVFILVVATLIFIFRPQPTFEAGKAVPVPEEVTPPAEQAATAEQPSPDELRRAAMHAEFDELAHARRNLEQKLNKLKVVLWDVKLPRAESEAITETMKNSYAMLKNLKLLGAYSGVEQISTELARVKYLYAQLQEIEDKYRSKETQ